jgi:hypothetical protein
MVVVKVGRPSERQRPGNRGKRDSQILLLHYLNRVHFDAPMYPLELEIYHQMRNVIGIDPAFYEYIFMVDADTVRLHFVSSMSPTNLLGSQTVTSESLNRLVAVTSDDAQVIAVCGETKLDNEEGSWWTMIQVRAPGVDMHSRPVHHRIPGLRVLHFAPSREGIRVPIRFCDLFAWLLQHVPHPYRRQRPPAHYLQPDHRRILRM